MKAPSKKKIKSPENDLVPTHDLWGEGIFGISYELLHKIEIDIDALLKENHNQARAGDLLDVIGVKENLRKSYYLLEEALEGNESALMGLEILLVTAYKAAALGLGSNFSKIHTLTPDKRTRSTHGRLGAIEQLKIRESKTEQWRTDIMPFLISERAANPYLGRYKVAEKAMFQCWPLSDDEDQEHRPIGVDSIDDYAKKLEDAGILPRKQNKTPPRGKRGNN